MLLTRVLLGGAGAFLPGAALAGAGFAGAAFFGAGLASDELLSESEDDSFLATFLAGFLMTWTDSEEESESSLLDSTFFFFGAIF